MSSPERSLLGYDESMPETYRDKERDEREEQPRQDSRERTDRRRSVSRSPARSTSDRKESGASRYPRTIFISGYDERDTERDIRKMFEKYGQVDKVDVKARFSFVTMPNVDEAEDAIRGLGKPSGSRMRVEFTRGDGEVKRREETRRQEANSKPSPTLFVVNFDPERTRNKDLEELFSPFGELSRCEIKKNFAFVEYRNLDDAVKAKDTMNGTPIGGRNMVVEYQARPLVGGGGGYRRSPPRARSPIRRDYDRYDRRDTFRDSRDSFRRSRSRERYDDRRDRDRWHDDRERRRSRSPYR